MLDINNIFFTLGGAGVSYLEFLSVAFGLSCVFLAGRNSKYNFYFGYIYTLLLCVMFAQKHLYSSMLLQPVSLAINIVGHWKWTHPKKGEESAADSSALRVSSLSWKQRIFCVLQVLFWGLAWGLVLSRLGDSWFPDVAPAKIPYLDACTTMTILLAQTLSSMKKWDCWIVWLFVNTMNLVLYLKAGLVFMPIVAVLYLLNGLLSLHKWYRLYKNKC